MGSIKGICPGQLRGEGGETPLTVQAASTAARIQAYFLTGCLAASSRGFRQSADCRVGESDEDEISRQPVQPLQVAEL